MELPINQIIYGDCLEVMREFGDNTFDTIITDPPYGLGFMGKHWDTFDKSQFGQAGNEGENDPKVKKNFKILPRFKTGGLYDFTFEWASEALRVAKPGAFMLCFGGSRTSHRIACAIEDAGWQIRDTIMWLYGSGFPKSANISLMFDKQACIKELTEKLGRKPDKKEFENAWKNFRKVNETEFLNCTKQNDPTKSSKRYKRCLQCGKLLFSPDPCKCPKSEPITDEAKLWNGWGTALKPAFEPIIVAMKPLDGTFTDNALKHGVAGLNIDGARIGTDEEVGRNNKHGPYETSRTWNTSITPARDSTGLNKGRWPANVILDSESAAMLDEQVQTQSSVGIKGGTSPNPMSWGNKRTDASKISGYSDQGGVSRFFYTAKADKAERNVGCEGMPLKNGGSNAKGYTEDVAKGLDRNRPVANFHPTVKPLDLMEYLCKLTMTPPAVSSEAEKTSARGFGQRPQGGGIVLDPFGGSGTTALACINTGRDFVLIEKEADYCKIAEARIKAIQTGIPIKQQDKNQKPLFESA
jgi:site-specific DNA-methyltransferase (adenine-specific)